MKASKYTKETINGIGVKDLNFPDFHIGDTISVSLKIKEGDKERLQAFVGDVIAMHKNGASSSFMVRKIASNNIAVERIFYSSNMLLLLIQNQYMQYHLYLTF